MARSLRLDELLDRKPAQLSGGQRQRVALARAIVRRPRVFLMDEPLSNLDAQLRVEMRAELVELHARLGITIIYVTHDQVEAMTMGHRIAIMNDGVLQQLDTPRGRARPSRQRLRGRLHRQPPDEHPAGRRRPRVTTVLRGRPGRAVVVAQSPRRRPAPAGDLDRRRHRGATRGTRHRPRKAPWPPPSAWSSRSATSSTSPAGCPTASSSWSALRPGPGARHRHRRHRRPHAPRASCTLFDPSDRLTASMHAPAPSRVVREAGVGYLFVLPAVAVFGVFVFYPLVKTAYLGFFATPAHSQPSGALRGHLAVQIGALARLTSATACGAPCSSCSTRCRRGLVLGLGLAVLANQRLAGIRIFRTIYSSTVATSTAVASVIFFTLLDPQIGLLNYWLGKQGGSGVLQNTSLALPAVSVVTIWQNIGFTFILMSAALQAVPDDLLEAARDRRCGARGPAFAASRCRCSPP